MSYYPYYPRDLTPEIGIWTFESCVFKVYGIVAENRHITDSMLDNAREFIRSDVLQRIASSQDNDGLGFVIIHPGELGVSVLALWWIQGSVLCQHVNRWSDETSLPKNMSSLNVLGCVWELGLINAEQEVWRKTMMGDKADAEAYLQTRASIKTV